MSPCGVNFLSRIVDQLCNLFVKTSVEIRRHTHHVLALSVACLLLNEANHFDRHAY